MTKQLCNFSRLLLFFFILMSSISQTQARDYYFMANDDNFYVNPANWYPHYPGIKIDASDKVFIQEDVFFEGLTIEVYGKVEIVLGAEMVSSDGELLIRPSGKLNNFGTVSIKGIRNHGIVTNNIGSMTQLKFYSTHQNAITDNMPSANLVISGDAINVGVFNNYGYCSVGHDLYNLEESVFNQIQKSELVVRGTLQAYASSKMNHSDASVFEFSKEVELSPAENKEQDEKLSQE